MALPILEVTRSRQVPSTSTSRIGGAYFDVLDTEYTLRPVNGGTEFRARMSYRVSTSFNWYARPIAEFLIGNFEEKALRFYARRATR
jgi:hypothetical protein